MLKNGSGIECAIPEPFPMTKGHMRVIGGGTLNLHQERIMTEPHTHKNLADKRKQIQAYIGSLERDLEQARRDLSHIIATERVFQSRGPKVTAYMNLSAMFPRHELPKPCMAAMAVTSPISTKDIAAYVIAEKNLPATDKYVRKAITYRCVQVMRRWEKMRKVERVEKAGTTIVWVALQPA